MIQNKMIEHHVHNIQHRTVVLCWACKYQRIIVYYWSIYYFLLCFVLTCQNWQLWYFTKDAHLSETVINNSSLVSETSTISLTSDDPPAAQTDGFSRESSRSTIDAFLFFFFCVISQSRVTPLIFADWPALLSARLAWGVFEKADFKWGHPDPSPLLPPFSHLLA